METTYQNIKNTDTIREAVGIFDDARKFERAIHALQLKFPHHALSVSGREEIIKEQLANPQMNNIHLIRDKRLKRHAPIKREERNIATGFVIGVSAYLGAIGAALLAVDELSTPLIITVATLGGILFGGAAYACVLAYKNKKHRQAEQQINSSGLFLWVNTPTPEEEALTCNILKEYGAIYVEAHSIQ